jgi:hypothetical protein
VQRRDKLSAAAAVWGALQEYDATVVASISAAGGVSGRSGDSHSDVPLCCSGVKEGSKVDVKAPHCCSLLLRMSGCS